MSEPSLTAVKTLFAQSGNKCFYSPCDEDLTDPTGRWKRVNGEVAHIKGEHPTAARYDETQDDADRQGFENLMLLCPKHHKLTDWLEPDAHDVDRLTEMRANALLHGSSTRWATAVDAAVLDRVARDAVMYFLAHLQASSGDVFAPTIIQGSASSGLGGMDARASGTASAPDPPDADGLYPGEQTFPGGDQHPSEPGTYSDTYDDTY